MNYAVDESSGEEDDDDGVFNPNRARATKRRKTSVEDTDEDVFVANVGAEDDMAEEGMLPSPQSPSLVQLG